MVLLLLCLLLLTLRTLTRISPFEPVKFFLYAWIFSTALLASRLVDYPNPLDLSTFFSISTSIAAFVAGGLFYRSRSAGKRLARGAASLASLPPPSLLHILSLLALIYSGMQAIALLQAEPGHLLEDPSAGLSALRADHWDRYAAGVKTNRAAVVGLTRACAIFFVISFPIFLQRRKVFWALTSIFAATGLLFDAVLSAARLTFLFSISASAYCALLLECLRGRRLIGPRMLFKVLGPAKSVMAAIGIVWITYVVFAWFPAMRSPHLLVSVEPSLMWAAGAKMSVRAKSLSETLGLESLPVLIASTSYFSSPISNYTFFREHGGITDTYEFGAYNFPAIAVVQSLLTGERSSWH